MQGNDHSTDHLQNLKEFVNKLRDSARNVLQTRAKYEKVVTLIAYWQKPDHEEKPSLDHLRASAKRLRILFDERYGFDVDDVFEIPNDKYAYNEFHGKLTERIKPIQDDEKSLFILYYGGHAELEDSTIYWKAEKTESSENLIWSSAQTILLNSSCDKLFLFDCCHAGAMISRNTKNMRWHGRTELFGSSTPHRKTDSDEKASFTKALLNELKIPGRDIISVWGELNNLDKLKGYGLQKGDPYYFPIVSCRTSITLNPLLKPNDTEIQNNARPANSPRQSDARVLIKVAFSDTMDQIMDEWKNFISHAPYNVLRLEFGAELEMDVRLQALFPSNSCTAIFEIPLRLWAAILPDSIEAYFSIIRGDMWCPDQIFPLTPLVGLLHFPCFIMLSSKGTIAY
jgi:caspase domain-containing protein